MANVQKENGYTAIANELLEAICNSGFSAMELKVILTIARFTYGFSQKENEMSLGFIANFIKSKGRSHVSEAVTRLISANVINLIENDSQTRVLKINKDYDTWKLRCSEIGNSSRKGNRSVPEKGTEVFPKREQILYKENNKKNNKENIYENSSRKGNRSVPEKGTPNPDFISEFEKLWKIYPRKKGKSSVTKKAMKELQEAGVDTVKKAIENYKAEIQKFHTQEQYIMHGSTFFNGGWKDYTESEVNGDADPYVNIGTNL